MDVDINIFFFFCLSIYIGNVVYLFVRYWMLGRKWMKVVCGWYRGVIVGRVGKRKIEVKIGGEVL